SGTDFLKQASGRPNLHVRTSSEVTRIVTEGQRAVAVDVRRAGQSQATRIHARREILVTSGAIGSPRLLMLSGIGPADHLTSVKVPVVHDLPGVGSNLQDHVDLAVLSECSGDYSYDSVQKLHRTIWAGVQYLLFRSGPVASSLFETGGFWYADPQAEWPEMQFHFGQGSGIEKGIAKLDNPGVTLNSAFMRPRSRGTVRLASGNGADAPLIDPNYWSDPYDREMSLNAFEITRDIMRRPALESFIRREVMPGSDVTSRKDLFDFACQIAKTQHHPVGTCKMGHDDMAVVGPDLKVHGMENLRVCDSSIMPTVNSSNTQAPTIMIGEKGADLVAGKDPLPPAVFDNERNDRQVFADA
ncbi:MAG: GMC family oxidoreductase, partial [Alphaproteobacteria bacterium]